LTGCIRSSSPTTCTPGSGRKRRRGPAADRLNALARVGENSLTIAWVHHSLTQRCAAYRFALDHLVAAESERVAADAGVVLTQLQQRIAANQVVPLPRFAAVSGKL
jgi:hypothetical protein